MCFDSRSLMFGADVRSVVGDEGVDVVLNSLSGSAIRESLLDLMDGLLSLERLISMAEEFRAWSRLATT